VVDEARGARQALVIDETLHGHEQVPSLWRDLLRFPLWPALLQAALALGFWLWSGWGRFGAPLPEPVGLAAGKSVLIDNTASLLAAAGHSSYTLGRYFDVALFDVARALHAPPGAKPPAIEQIVRAAGRRKGATVDFGQLREQVERLKRLAGARPEAVVSVARRVHRWRNELVRGGGIGASHPH